MTVRVPMAFSGDMSARLEAQRRARAEFPDRARIKVNLYTGWEARAVAAAVSELETAGEASRIDCLMVADSYLMTHLGRASTRLESEAEQRSVFEMMTGLVGDVAREAKSFPGDPRPWVLGDLPDGAAATPAKAVDSIGRMIEAGADAVKVEVVSTAVFDAIEAAAARGAPTVAHIGYKPQVGVNRKHGDTEEEALELFAEARRARDAGAIGLVLERVSQPVMGMIAKPDPRGLPVWAIFCGQAPGAGQSLNVFDSVIRPAFRAFGFPPTATMDRGAFPGAYGHEAIAAHFAELLRMTHRGSFPPKLPSSLTPEAMTRLGAANPWR